jgi:hypothetical protein
MIALLITLLILAVFAGLVIADANHHWWDRDDLDGWR